MKNSEAYGRICKGVLFTFLVFSGPLTAQVQIAEVDAFGNLEDGLGRGEDWIELVNAGGASVALGDLRLSDDPNDWGKWRLPNVTLAPQERLLLWCSGRDIAAVDH